MPYEIITYPVIHTYTSVCIIYIQHPIAVINAYWLISMVLFCQCVYSGVAVSETIYAVHELAVTNEYC